MAFDFLPTLAEQQATRRAVPKHQIEPRIVSKEKAKAAKKLNAETFRKAVWKRDGGKCRATGVPLSKSGLDPHRVGECDHTLLRSTHPERVYDSTNGVLLSKFLNRLRKVACRNNPQFRMFDYDGDSDRGKPQTFTWRDDDGNITKERLG